MVLILFSERVLLLWTGDATLSAHVAPLLRLLALGTLLHGLMWVPYQMQLANGWTNLSIRMNMVAVAILIPLLLYAVPLFGAIGAAAIWVALNLSYVIFDIQLMHRRLMPEERTRWYVQDVGVPLGCAFVIAELGRITLPGGTARLQSSLELAALSLFVVSASAASAPVVRRAALKEIHLIMGWLRARS